MIAGSTAPTGANDVYRTSPQSFAEGLAKDGAAAYFDVYAHHPYVPGGSAHMDPGLSPANPAHTVSLSNIATLLKIFPGKPFYLSEYGFSTRSSDAFGAPVTESPAGRLSHQGVRARRASPADQAARLVPAAGHLADRHAHEPRGLVSGAAPGLGCDAPAWYAFARGNHVSLSAPSRARRGSHIVLTGSYACASIGGVPGRHLLIERRKGVGSWRVVRAVTTGARGRYSARVLLGATERWRVVFAGVAKSRTRLVAAR